VGLQQGMAAVSCTQSWNCPCLEEGFTARIIATISLQGQALQSRARRLQLNEMDAGEAGEAQTHALFMLGCAPKPVESNKITKVSEPQAGGMHVKLSARGANRRSLPG